MEMLGWEVVAGCELGLGVSTVVPHQSRNRVTCFIQKNQEIRYMKLYLNWKSMNSFLSNKKSPRRRARCVVSLKGMHES